MAPASRFASSLKPSVAYRDLNFTATLYGDGGGKAPAIRAPLVGALRVAKALIGWRPMALDQGVTYRVAAVNGEPGIVYYWPDGRVAGVQELEIADGVVVAVRAVLNPDKLAHVTAEARLSTE